MRLIGITPFRSSENGRLCLSRDYADALRQANALPVILPMESDEKRLEELLSRIDGLLLSGGEDVDPKLYGEETLPCCGEIDTERDTMEMPLTRMALEKNMPVLAICRGIQVLNVAAGGTLYQDVAEQYKKEVEHPVYKRPREKVHEMHLVPDTMLSKIIGFDQICVNSRHHQAVKEPGKGLIVCARAADGLIEGVEMPDKRFVLGVQWHPESLCSYSPEALAVFEAFVRACDDYAAEKA